MKHQTVLWGAAAITAALLTGCGHGHHSMTVSSSSSSSSSSGSSSSSSSSSGSSSSSSGSGAQSVDTAQVLSLAQTPSETATPFSVDSGYTITDTSEMTAPITVDK